jgi:hypothetical protein
MYRNCESKELHDQTNFLCFNAASRNIHKSFISLLNGYKHLPQDHCYTTLIVYVKLTMTCSTRTYTDFIVALPLQQWLDERARKVIGT